MRSVHTTRAHPHTHSVSVLISLETAAGSGRPKGMPKGGLVFIAALKQGSVFILGGIHSAFRVKCKRADVFSYYPPQMNMLHGWNMDMHMHDALCVRFVVCSRVSCPGLRFCRLHVTCPGLRFVGTTTCTWPGEQGGTGRVGGGRGGAPPGAGVLVPEATDQGHQPERKRQKEWVWEEASVAAWAWAAVPSARQSRGCSQI